jgi:hypothetical protein
MHLSREEFLSEHFAFEKTKENHYYCVYCGTDLYIKGWICSYCVKRYRDLKKKIQKVNQAKKKELLDELFEDPWKSDYFFKIILAGDLQDDHQKLYSDVMDPGWNLPFSVKFGIRYETIDQNKLTLQLWDINVTNTFKHTHTALYRGAKGAMVLFDLNDSGSLQELKSRIKAIRREVPDIPFIILGNNFHLFKNQTEMKVSPLEIWDFIKEHNIDLYMSVSCETGLNIYNAILEILELVMNRKR